MLFIYLGATWCVWVLCLGLNLGVKTHYEGTNLGNFTTCIVYNVHFQNVLHLILDFASSVWVLCFDFHKFNDI
jgi:hypothetical protein